ncbi:YdcF family protein [Nocardia sp. NPDC003482]
MVFTGALFAAPTPAPPAHADALPVAVARGPETAIVVLGYGLRPDGTMRDELIARLQAGYVQALLSPRSPIIVTGGNPRAGITEADAMAGWLIARGIAPDRIHLDPAATDTLENAANSADLMRTLGAADAVLVTSADHMSRAASNFTDAGVSIVAEVTPDFLHPLLAVPFGA